MVNNPGCPCRIDFSRAEAALIASNGSETSMSFLRNSFMVPVIGGSPGYSLARCFSLSYRSMNSLCILFTIPRSSPYSRT